MKNLVNKFKRKINSRIFIDYNKNYKTSIFLAGTGRSGTTWVSNIVNYKNEYRYIFEPFHSYKLNICKEFEYRQYLRPENQKKKYIKPAKIILSGKIRNGWTDSQNKKFICKKRLIKDIRANHLLKWIQVNFPGIPIILLLRHPCAVAASKLKLKWDTYLEKFLRQEDLVEDFLKPFKKEIKKTHTVFEKHIFLWCIENYVPLKQFQKNEIHLAFYENFCEDPESEIKRLFLFLNKKFDKKVLIDLKKPSLMTRKDSAVVIKDNLINGWRKYISSKQMQKAVEILSIFGLDSIYSQNSLPNIDSAYKLMQNKHS